MPAARIAPPRWPRWPRRSPPRTKCLPSSRRPRRPPTCRTRRTPPGHLRGARFRDRAGGAFRARADRGRRTRRWHCRGARGAGRGAWRPSRRSSPKAPADGIALAQLGLLEDPELAAAADAEIAAGRSAGFAWRAAIRAAEARLRATGNQLLIERIDDLRGYRAPIARRARRARSRDRRRSRRRDPARRDAAAFPADGARPRAHRRDRAGARRRDLARRDPCRRGRGADAGGDRRGSHRDRGGRAGRPRCERRLARAGAGGRRAGCCRDSASPPKRSVAPPKQPPLRTSAAWPTAPGSRFSPIFPRRAKRCARSRRAPRGAGCCAPNSCSTTAPPRPVRRSRPKPMPRSRARSAAGR